MAEQNHSESFSERDIAPDFASSLNAAEEQVIDEIRVTEVPEREVCSWCHEESSVGSQFCNHCGLAIGELPLETLDPNSEGAVSSKKVSSLGIASTLVSVLLGLLFVASVIVALFLPENADSLWFIVLAVAWSGFFLGGVGGFGLSIGAFIQKGRSRLFPAIGLFFNLILIAGVLVSLLVGLVYAMPAGEVEDEEEVDAYKFVRQEVLRPDKDYS